MRYTYKDVKEIVEKEGYELLSTEEEIVNNKGFVTTVTKIKIWCKNPNHKPSIKSFNNFKNGRKCRECGIDKKKIPYEKIKKVIESIDDGYELLTQEKDFESAKKTRLTIKCNKQHIYTTSWDSIHIGSKCPQCHLENKSLGIDYVRKFIEDSGYKLLSTKYETNQTPLLVKCPNENHEPYYTTFSRFQQGKRCKECRAENYRFSYECVKEYIESFGYKLLSTEYKNANKKILIQCDKEHEPYEVKFSDFQGGFRCPHCKNSKGEDKVIEILEKYNIDYNHQYKFKDCKFKQQLPFDFYLPKYNCCIEYDGKQHYEMIEHWGGFNHFVDTKIRDTIKNIYCKDNDINLIRIPYWEFDNIEKILIKEINKYE